MIAVDTNIYIYALDVDDPRKQAIAQDLFTRLSASQDQVVLLWQVAVELLANLRKRESQGLITTGDLESHFADFKAMFPLVLPTELVFDGYFRLKGKYLLSHWDAMLLGACIEVKVETLYSEDLSPTVLYEGVKVINPFVSQQP